MSAELAIANQVKSYGMRVKEDIYEQSDWELLLEQNIDTNEIYCSNTHILMGSDDNNYLPFIMDIDGTNKIEIPNPNPSGDTWGEYISLSNTKMVITNRTADGDVGAAYIYDLDGTNMLTIKPSITTNDTYFGSAIDISETKIVVGAFAYGSPSNPFRAGAAWIFDIDGSNEIILTAPVPQEQFHFGAGVAINSSNIFVSEPGSNNHSNTQPGSGTIYMYDLNGTLIKQFYPEYGISASNFGYQLYANETHIITNNRWYGAGEAYIFNIITGEQVVITPEPYLNITAWFAHTVQISNSHVIISASHANWDGNKIGTACVYDLNGKNMIPVQQKNLIPNGYFGYINAINNNGIMVNVDNDGDVYQMSLHSIISENVKNFIDVSQDIIDSGVELPAGAATFIPYYGLPPFAVEFTTTGGIIRFYIDAPGKYTINDGEVFGLSAGVNDINTIAGDIIRINSETTSFKFDKDYQLIETCSVDAKLMTSIEDLCNNQRYLTTFSMINSENITNMDSAFVKCYGLTEFPLIDTSSVTNMNATWYHCMYITEFPLIDTSSVTNMNSTWYECRGLTEFPLVDTSSATTMVATWAFCFKLAEFPLIDTSSVTQFSSTWWFCFGLISFPAIDTSIATSVSQAWMGCTGLETFPALDYSTVVWFQSAWKDASSLESLTLSDTSNGMYFATLFEGCTSLKCLSGIDTTSAADTKDMFKDCDVLTSPSSAEQTAIKARSNYVNPENCPTVYDVEVTTIGGQLAFSTTGSGTVYKNGVEYSTVSAYTTYVDTIVSDVIQISLSGPDFYFRDSHNVIKTIKVDATNLSVLRDLCNSQSNLIDVDIINSSNVTTIYEAFRYCTALTTFPLIDTQSVIDMGSTWFGCSNLLSFPAIDTSSVADFRGTWALCESLTSFPAIDTSAGTDFRATWSSCTNLVCLTSVNTLNIPNATLTDGMFNDCTSLSEPYGVAKATILDPGLDWVNGRPCL